MINPQKQDCSGCTACASICPRAAIELKPDELGFLYPKVDLHKCVKCGLCEKTCQFNKEYQRYDNYETSQAYAFRLKEDYQLKRSQSGGAFYAVAKQFISTGGAVYGAAFTENWEVRHIRVKNETDLERLRMSKYVQSNIRGILPLIKKDLVEGTPVLFSGTACQVAGLKSYIPYKLHSHLLCVDIICHGVPSPRIWKDYINYLGNKHHSKIKEVCFRDKKYGWHGARETYTFANGDTEARRTYNHLYFNGLTLRLCCATCKFTNTQRVGDITLGDMWGLPKDSPYEDGKGLSLVLVNSDKGNVFFSSLRGDYLVEAKELEECRQPQLAHPTIMAPQYRNFVCEYEKRGFLYVVHKYGDMGWRYKLNQTRDTIKDIFRHLIKG